GEDRLQLADSTIARSYSSAIPSVVASPEVARRLLTGIPNVSRAAALPDSIYVRVSFQPHAVSSSNVACMLPGTDPRLKDTAIAYSAHYDHLGIGAPDEKGDSIYNGFSDNAAGVGMLLAIAEAFGARPASRPRHSML